MAKLPQLNLPEITVRYPTSATQNLNSVTSYAFNLKQTQGVLAYDFVCNEGSLVGGTTPLWAAAFATPIVTHVKIAADNDTIVDVDVPLLSELQYLMTHVKPDGTFFTVEMCDRDWHTGLLMPISLFPSWIYNQIQCTLTFNTVANITSGSPTTTPITIDVTERDIPRASVNFKPLRKKLLQVSSALTLTGNNDLTSFLAQTGAYKGLVLFSTSSSSSPYSNAAATNINTFDLILNDTATVRSDSWTPLIKATQNLFQVAPDSGYVVMAFMPGAEASQLLDLRNTQKITSVDLRVNTAGGSDFLYCLRVVYQ